MMIRRQRYQANIKTASVCVSCWSSQHTGYIVGPNVILMLCRRLRRWANINPALVRLVFAGQTY